MQTSGMSTRVALSIALSVVVAAAAACSSSAATDGPPPPPAPGPDGGAATPDAATPSPALSWSPCDLKSEGGGPKAECAVTQVPLRAGEPGGKTIDFHVKRYRPKDGKGLRQLWMLQGGPGGSAYVFESMVEAIGGRFPDVDFYLPDHRGTGKSSRVGCAAEGATTEGGFFITAGEWPSCLADVKAKLGADLEAYSTTNAANDLGVAIERARTPGQGVYVYGVSYGTYWANRYMQLYPEQADGVILDSLAPPAASLARQDQDANEAAKDLLDLCAKDALCGAKLGADPWAKANALVTKLKAGHCAAIGPAGVPVHELFRQLFGQFLMHPDYRKLIAPMIHRADRCEQRDIDALKPFLAAQVGEPEVNEMLRQWGWVLGYHVLFSELWEAPSPTAADLAAIREGAVASRDVTAGMDALVGKWPAYPGDAYMGKWPDRKKPVLVLQGGLDPATLLRKARPGKAVFTKPGQHWIEIPSATHTVIASSVTTEKRSCGTLIMMSFLEDAASPDTSCLAKVVPLDFAVPASLTQGVFGTTDAWD